MAPLRGMRMPARPRTAAIWPVTVGFLYTAAAITLAARAKPLNRIRFLFWHGSCLQLHIHT